VDSDLLDATDAWRNCEIGNAQPFRCVADIPGVSVIVERPEVAVVRHPIADARNNVVGYELRFGGAVDLSDPAARFHSVRA
jgi:hypothetical protein